jgi:hypothetical protein
MAEATLPARSASAHGILEGAATNKRASFFSRSKTNAKAGLMGLAKSSSSQGTASGAPKDKEKEGFGAMLVRVTSKTGFDSKDRAAEVNGASGMTSSKVIVGAVKDNWPLYSSRRSDYEIGEPIGFGSSSVVHLATFSPAGAAPITCAVKIIDVDKLSSVGDIDRLRRYGSPRLVPFLY